MSREEDRREALIKAARLARVRPGLDYTEAAIAADAAAAYLLDFMYRNGEFALGLLQAASYMLSGVDREEYETLDEANRLTDRAIGRAPRNPDVLRRAYTIFQRLADDPNRPDDIILTDANWETLPKRELLE
jgi:hypothetical protein